MTKTLGYRAINRTANRIWVGRKCQETHFLLSSSGQFNNLCHSTIIGRIEEWEQGWPEQNHAAAASIRQLFALIVEALRSVIHRHACVERTQSRKDRVSPIGF